MKTRRGREERTTAVAVGLPYILATVAGVAAMLLGATSEVAQVAGSKGALFLVGVVAPMSMLSLSEAMMVLAVWLIVRGFGPSATAAGSTVPAAALCRSLP